MKKYCIHKTYLINKTLNGSMIHLFHLGNVVEGRVVRRPSSRCKTPYVADVVIGRMEIMAHAASLGCGGLSDRGSSVIMTLIVKEKNVCKHKIMLAKIYDPVANIPYFIGIDPKLAEQIVETALSKNIITCLQNTRSYTREVRFLNSRFDFAGVDQTGREFVLEIKNAPSADYFDCNVKERKKCVDSDHEFIDKISYFPNGHRKIANAPISPRALKHVEELSELVRDHNKRAILCFVIQRTDVTRFQPSIIDPVYRKAVQMAYFHGVEIMTIVVHWSEDGHCYFVKDNLPIYLYDNCDVLPSDHYETEIG